MKTKMIVEKEKIIIFVLFYSVMVLNEANTHNIDHEDHDLSNGDHDTDHGTDHGTAHGTDHYRIKPERHRFSFHDFDEEMYQQHGRKCDYTRSNQEHKISFKDYTTIMTGLFRYPFAVAILKKDNFYASGVLVDRKWVLSSAKEFYDKPVNRFSARIGSLNSRRGGVLIEIRKIIIFPLYVYNEPNFDIALLKLVRPVNLSEDVQTVSWMDNDISIYVTIYWPRVYILGKQVAKTAPERINHNHIRATPQVALFREECSKRLSKDNMAMEPPTMCLNPIQTLHSPCMADPGAPVLSYTGLMGITSGWVSPRCRLHPSQSPIIITRTSSPLIRSWMRDVIEKRRHSSSPKKKSKKPKPKNKYPPNYPLYLRAQQNKSDPQLKKPLRHNLDHKHYDGWM